MKKSFITSGPMVFSRQGTLLLSLGGDLFLSLFIFNTTCDPVDSTISTILRNKRIQHYLLVCLNFRTDFREDNLILLSSADFLQNYHFQKILSAILSLCKTVWIQIRPDIMVGLICVQIVYKGCQQTTPAGRDFMKNVILHGF